MSTTKGFIIFPGLRDNAPGLDAQFGELSHRSYTFSREQGVYPSSNGETVYRSFYSVDNNDDPAPVLGPVQNAIHAVAQALYDGFVADTMPPTITELVTVLQSNPDIVSAGIDVNTLELADQIYEEIGGVPGSNWLPASFSFTTNGGAAVRVWTHNDTFEVQYDEYEIFVLPPTQDSVDELNVPTNQINNLIVTNTSGQAVLNKINSIVGSAPATYQDLYPIVWNDPNGTSFTYSTPWIFVGYGPGANNPAAVRAAIREYIITNATVPQGVWQVIYPVLYESMEFYLIPFWDKIAIPELGPDRGIHSPVLDDMTLPRLRALDFVPGVDPNTVDSATVYLPTLANRSLAMVAVGNVNNTGSIMKLNQLYPDYFIVPTTDADSGRLSEETFEFIQRMSQASQIAETATSTSSVPSGFAITTRQGKVFVTFTNHGADFLMVTRQSLLAGI